MNKAPKRKAGAVWRGDGDEAIQPLRADLVDVPIKAAQCDPLTRLPPEKRDVVTDTSALFPSTHSGLQLFKGIRGSQREEYIKIVVAQLKAGKLGLSSRVVAGGTVFGRMKANGTSMRLIWHGSAVSQCAARPPLPPHLASPCCFTVQELRAGERLFVSKRDAQCYFDQLRLPECLRQYMAQPMVTRTELEAHGFCIGDFVGYLESDASHSDQGWWPVSRVWCMGFSWSSAIGQQTLLDV